MREKNYLSAVDVATELAVRQSKVLAWIKSGELPASDLSQHPGVGKARWRIRRSDLDDFMRSRQLGTPAASNRRRKPKLPAGWIEYV